MPLLAYAEDLPVVRRWWRHVLGSPPPRRAAPIPTDDPPINTLYLTTRTATRLEPHIEYAWAALRRHALRW